MNRSSQTAIQATWFSIAGNIILAFLKGAAGVLGNSYALIADAIESTADVLASFVVLIGLRIASKPADKNHPYGHGRIEPLVTFIVVGFLIVSATVIAIQSIHNIRTPHELPKTWTLFVLGGIIIWKEVSFHVVMRRARTLKSSLLKADAWHHRSDAITSVTAFVGICIALLAGKGFEAADDWAALLGAAIILYNSFAIFRPALGEIMDEHLHDDVITEVRRIALTVPGVIATEKCFARKAGLKYFVDLHIIVDGDLSVRLGHDIAHNLKASLQEKMPQVENVLIHVEPEVQQPG